MQRRFHFLSALAGGLVAALVVTALPVIAQDADTQAAIGDPFLLGQTNTVNARSVLRGDAGTSSNLVIRNTGGAPPLGLQTAGGGQPPLVVDSRGKVRNLNADLLDNRNANGLMRAAFQSSNNAADANGDAVTVNITAPQPGVLIMGGSIESYAPAGDADFFSCRVRVNDVTVPGTERDVIVHYAGSPHSANDEENCSTDGGLVVAKGTHTVALNIANRNTAALNEATIWVIWSPFNGQGAVPPANNPTGDPGSQPLVKNERP